LISCLFHFLLFISNLQASNVAAGINVPLPHALDCALNAIIPSELPFLDVEAKVAEIVSMAVQYKCLYQHQSEQFLLQ
jgi:hypothetical protein